jgi:hypothetical protein
MSVTPCVTSEVLTAERMIAFWVVTQCKSASTVRILRESRGGGCRLWCDAGGMCTGGWTKGLLLVGNSMTHQGVTLLHTD